MICSILKSLAAVRRENTSASNVFVFVCVFSSLPPALCTAAAFYLSGQQSGFSELAGHVCLKRFDHGSPLGIGMRKPGQKKNSRFYSGRKLFHEKELIVRAKLATCFFNFFFSFQVPILWQWTSNYLQIGTSVSSFFVNHSLF